MTVQIHLPKTAEEEKMEPVLAFPLLGPNTPCVQREGGNGLFDLRF